MHENNRNRWLEHRKSMPVSMNKAESQADDEKRAMAPKRNKQSDGTPSLPANTKLRERRMELAGWLPRFTDDSQRKAGRNIALFFAMLLIFTVIARGTAAATLAEVETVSLGPEKVVKSIKGSGTVLAGDSVTMNAPSGLKVEEVLAQVGSKVKKGDPLLRFSLEDVQEQLAREEAQLKALQLNLEKLNQTADESISEVSKAKQDLLWANEDYSSAQKSADSQVQSAQAQCDSAYAALKAAKEALSAAENQPQDSTEDEEAAENESAARDIAALKEDVKAAHEQVEGAEAALKTAKQQRETELKAAARAVKNAEDGLKAAEQSDVSQQREKENADKQNQIDAQTVKLDIQAQERKIEELKPLADEGLLRSGADGIVNTVPELGGEGTVTLSDISGGFDTTIVLDKSKIQDLYEGMEAEVIKGGGYMGGELLKAAIDEISPPDESGMVKVKLKLPKGEWEQGETVEIRIVKEQKQSQNCIQVSALRSNSEGYYLLVLEERSSVLGTEYILVEIPVTVSLMGDSHAVVEGAFSPNMKVVNSSTKPINGGDKVKVSVS